MCGGYITNIYIYTYVYISEGRAELPPILRIKSLIEINLLVR